MNNTVLGVMLFIIRKIIIFTDHNMYNTMYQPLMLHMVVT